MSNAFLFISIPKVLQLYIFFIASKFKPIFAPNSQQLVIFILLDKRFFPITVQRLLFKFLPIYSFPNFPFQNFI